MGNTGIIFRREGRIVVALQFASIVNPRMAPWVLQVHKELRIELGCFRKKFNMNLSGPSLKRINKLNKRDLQLGSTWNIDQPNLLKNLTKFGSQARFDIII